MFGRHETRPRPRPFRLHSSASEGKKRNRKNGCHNTGCDVITCCRRRFLFTFGAGNNSRSGTRSRRRRISLEETFAAADADYFRFRCRRKLRLRELVLFRSDESVFRSHRRLPDEGHLLSESLRRRTTSVFRLLPLLLLRLRQRADVTSGSRRNCGGGSFESNRRTGSSPDDRPEVGVGVEESDVEARRPVARRRQTTGDVIVYDVIVGACAMAVGGRCLSEVSQYVFPHGGNPSPDRCIDSHCVHNGCSVVARRRQQDNITVTA